MLRTEAGHLCLHLRVECEAGRTCINAPGGREQLGVDDAGPRRAADSPTEIALEGLGAVGTQVEDGRGFCFVIELREGEHTSSVCHGKDGCSFLGECVRGVAVGQGRFVDELDRFVDADPSAHQEAVFDRHVSEAVESVIRPLIE